MRLWWAAEVMLGEIMAEAIFAGAIAKDIRKRLVAVDNAAIQPGPEGSRQGAFEQQTLVS